jgi:DNA-binding PadR family transcriptional regulator
VSTQKQMFALLKSLSGQANILTIPRLYITLLDGDHLAALFLSQIVYWSDKGKKPDGWFYKTLEDWKDETGLSRSQIDRITATLEKAGLIETAVRKANGAPTKHYRLNVDNLTDQIVKCLDLSETSKSDLQETDKSDLSETSKSDLSETSKSLTETTQRLQQQNTLAAAPQTCARAPVASPTPEELGFGQVVAPAPRRTSADVQTASIQALARGINRELIIWEEVLRHFRITPNPNTKLGRQFTSWYRSRPPGETLEKFAEWWYAKDFRGKDGQPPTLTWIMELWPQAFNTLDSQLSGEDIQASARAKSQAYLEKYDTWRKLLVGEGVWDDMCLGKITEDELKRRGLHKCQHGLA